MPEGVGFAGDAGRGLLLGLSAESAWAGVPPPFRRSPGRGGRLPGPHVGSGVSMCPGVGRAASVPASRCGAGSVHAACAARAARAAGLCARMCAAGWTSGLWGRCTRLCGSSRGPCDAAPAPPAPLQLPALGPGRWPPAYKRHSVPRKNDPVVWLEGGREPLRLPSFPNVLLASLLGAEPPPGAQLVLPEPCFSGCGRLVAPPSRQSEPCCPPAALARPAGPSWAQPGPLLPLLHDLRCR